MRKWFGVVFIPLFCLVFATVATAASLPEVARDGNFDELKKMIPLATDIHQTWGPDGRTALHWAAWSAPAEIVTMLIDKGADVNRRDLMKRTPLHYAAEHGNIPVMEVLLNKGADINARDNSDATPLMRVCIIDTARPNVADFLLKKGADVNAATDGGQTPFMIVVSRTVYNNELAQLIVNAGPKPNVQDNNGMTALMHCVYKKADLWQLPAAISTMPGTDVNLVNKDGDTALHYAAISRSNDAGKIINALIKQGANVNIQNKRGQTALFRAIDDKRDRNLATLIINGKADVKLADAEGVTPLHKAASQGNVPLMKFLIENGADINAKANNGMTVLFAAGNYAEVKAFVQQVAPAGSAAVSTPTEVLVSELSSSIGDIYSGGQLYFLKVDPSKAPFTGSAKQWYGNKTGGRLKLEAVFKSGIPVSLILYYDEPDPVKESEQVLDGDYCLVKTYHRTNGNLKSEERYVIASKGSGRSSYRKDGIFKEYHGNGTLAKEEGFVGGKREGINRSYDRKTGKLIEEVTISNGYKNGLLKEYYADGTIKKEVSYVDGKEEGMRKDYTDKGVLSQTQEFKNARPDGAKITYEKDGTTVKETQMFKEGRPVKN